MLKLNANILLNFEIGLIPLVVFAGAILFFGVKMIRSLFNRSKNKSPNTKITTAIVPLVFFAIVAIAIIGFCVHVMTDEGINYYTIMGKDKNRLALLNRGKVVQAEVTRAYYEPGAPAGWKVDYQLTADDPSTGQEKNYHGWSQGPKKYYKGLSAGDKVDVIYDPCDPRINCEMRRFLNNPSFRSTFRKAGELHLLDRYKDQYKLEDYTTEQWYRQQQRQRRK